MNQRGKSILDTTEYSAGQEGMQPGLGLWQVGYTQPHSPRGLSQKLGTLMPPMQVHFGRAPSVLQLGIV